ncbi:hypothetical protein [Mangrovimonas spongiae]|uniref:Membrane or secreted protein n=1 Tax=Mangrovimonas spongiae TaxID=2494697 RepID=A0A428K094_9FLAO|nr:hypothetical protein [Mangrovimonas spongiae]RSK39797.1 hypothetical protein EJA19_07905 [Mangrovimonas spongiae]
MKLKSSQKYIVLGVLFFLPVMFLLFLYPAKHNYDALDVVKANVSEINDFTSKEPVFIKDHLTVLAFLGNKPKEKLIEASNLKELVYDKFKGFKTFQIVFVLPKGSEQQGETLKKEIATYKPLEYLHLVYGSEQQINTLYSSLRSSKRLDDNLSSQQVFLIDKEQNQRGRLDDRTDGEIEKKAAVYPLLSYNCIEVAELKNKMSEDLRILFTEYRQKRKGNFDSTTRRANDIK